MPLPVTPCSSSAGAVRAIDRTADHQRGCALLEDQVDGRAAHEVEVAQRITAVEQLLDVDQAAVLQRLQRLPCAGAELAGEIGDRERRLGIGAEPLEQARGRVLRAGPGELADPLDRRLRGERK